MFYCNKIQSFYSISANLAESGLLLNKLFLNVLYKPLSCQNKHPSMWTQLALNLLNSSKANKTPSRHPWGGMLQTHINKVAEIVSGNCESMESYGFVDHESWLLKVWFVPYKMNPDLVCIVDHKSLMFLKDFICGLKSETDFEEIQPIFINPRNPHHSPQIFSTKMYYEQIWIHTNPVFQIPQSVSCSKDLFCGFVLSYCVQKICFVDLFCLTMFKRFISWIFLGTKNFPNYSIHIHSKGFVYEFCNLTYKTNLFLSFLSFLYVGTIQARLKIII